MFSHFALLVLDHRQALVEILLLSGGTPYANFKGASQEVVGLTGRSAAVCRLDHD